MDVAELVREARRLALLRFLLESPAYRMPLAVLGEALETVGHGVASNTVLEDAIWLKKQGLVSMWRAKGSDALELSPQGYEVARGFVLCPGVRRPVPNEAGRKTSLNPPEEHSRHRADEELSDILSELRAVRSVLERIEARLDAWQTVRGNV